MNPSQMLRNILPAQEVAMLSPAAKALAAQEVLQSQKSAQPFPQWSVARWQADRSGTTYTLAQRTRKAFGYGQGDAQVAGFAAGFQATDAETSLVQASQTNDNADFIIEGISAEYCSDQVTEPGLIGEVARNCSLQLALAGTTVFRLATLSQLPCGGGAYGVAPSITRAGALDQAQGAPVSYISNGNPLSESFLRLKFPVKWNASGGGKKDSSLNILIQQHRDIVWNCSADRAAAAGIVAFVAPTTIRLDIRFILWGYAISERSNNT